MSGNLGTGFSTGGFSFEPNLSPNNQQFAAAVRAVEATANQNFLGTTTFIGPIQINGPVTINTLASPLTIDVPSAGSPGAVGIKVIQPASTSGTFGTGIDIVWGMQVQANTLNTSANSAAGISLTGGTATLDNSDLTLYQTGDGQAILYNGGGTGMAIYTRKAKVLALDQLGTSPITVLNIGTQAMAGFANGTSGGKAKSALQLGANSLMAYPDTAGQQYLYIAANAYYDGDNWRYLSSVNDVANLFAMTNSANGMTWSLAPSGAAGSIATFTTFLQLVGATGKFIVGPAVGDQSLKVFGVNNQWSEWIVAGSTTSQSFGLLINGGTNSNDQVLLCNNSANTVNLFKVDGNGNCSINIAASTSNPYLTLATGQGFNPVCGVLYNAGTGNCLVMNNSGTDFGTVGCIASNIWGLGLTAAIGSLAAQSDCPIMWGGTIAAKTVGFFGTAPVVQKVSYGTPTGVVKTSSIAGTAATLAQVGGTLAALITDLKAYGIIGA